MRKEVILAVITGIILGGIILYGLNLANNSTQPQSAEETSVEKTSPTAAPSIAFSGLSIVTPQDHAVITEDTYTLKGTAKPNADIAIVTENDDILTVADTQGSFSAEINLISGENIITVTSADDRQSTSSASISVIHTTSLPE